MNLPISSPSLIHNLVNGERNFGEKKANIKNILFSPGYPSGDDYIDFEERGKAFNKLIERNFGT